MNDNSNIILDNINAIVSICDYETYNVLYLNKKALDVYGENTGEKCWTFLHNKGEEICSFCPKNRVNISDKKKKEFVWDFKHSKTKKWYEAHSKIINYKDRKAILEISYDISDRKKDEKQILNFLNYQNIISAVANIFNSGEDFNLKLNKSLESIGTQLSLGAVIILEKIDDSLKIANIWSNKNKNYVTKKILNNYISENDFNIKEIKERGRIKSNDIEKDFSGNVFKLSKTFGIKAIFMLPIKIENEIVGYFVLQDTKKNRKWHVREINLYKTIAEIFSNAIRRKRNEDKIIKMNKNYVKQMQQKINFFL